MEDKKEWGDSYRKQEKKEILYEAKIIAIAVTLASLISLCMILALR